MNHGKRIKICLIMLLTVLSLKLIILPVLNYTMYKPVKYGIKKNDVDTTGTFIVCEYVEVTGFYWRITEENGVPVNKYAILKGSDPLDICSHSVLSGGNKFLFYGKYLDESYDSAATYADEYVVFDVEDWEIFYPVRRATYYWFLLPKKYLYENKDGIMS